MANLFKAAGAGLLGASDYEFMNFVSHHGKSYATRDEFEFRANLFNESFDFVQKWNSDSANTHTVEINKFADWTKDEKKRLLGYKPTPNAVKNYATFDLTNLKDNVDWRNRGAVQRVKD
jgi:hypothetical protein